MKYYSDFLDYVLPSVPNCPTEIAEFALRNAAIELSEHSGWETKTLTPIDVVSGTGLYTLPTDSVDSLAFIDSVRYDGLDVPPVTEEELETEVFKWRTETGVPPRAYMQDDKGIIYLYPIPSEDKAGGLEVSISTKPTRDGSKVTDAFYEEFAEVVAAGALSRLFRMPRRPWTDLESSREQAAIFNRGKNDARTQKDKSKTTVGLHVKLKRNI